MACSGAPDVLEGPLLRVPFESLKRAAKDRKATLEEVQQLSIDALKAAELHASHENTTAAAEQLTKLVEALQDAKRRLADISKQERDEARRCKARLHHLQALSEPKPTMTAWNAQRLDRLLADCLEREGFHETAKLLVEHSGIQDLVDSHVFEEAKKIVAALRVHDCGPALAWCAANKARLKKAKSQLEFQLRVQEFIEQVKASDRLAAINYARTHLAPWAGQCMAELQRALAVLVFSNRMSVPARYQALLSESQWDTLAKLFYQDLYRLHGLPLAAPLLAHLQAGLSALKTPASYLPGSSCQDPLSAASFQELARQLPYAKHVRSQLLCSITRKLMDDANPPIVLPNGYVYSQQAIELIKAQHGGRVVCPQTGTSYSSDELRRAFVV